jgi:hypothetical protein
MKIYAILIVTLMAASSLQAMNSSTQNEIRRWKEAEMVTTLGAGLLCCLSCSQGAQPYAVPAVTLVIGTMFAEGMAHTIDHRDKKEILARRMSMDFAGKMHRD